MSLSGTSLATRGFVTSGGTAAGAVVTTGSLAGKPEAYLIVPEVSYLGANAIKRVTSEAGAGPGSVSPNAGNLGSIFPLQAGTLSEGAVDHDYQIVSGSGLEQAEWIWKRDEDDADQWRGTNDPRHWYFCHSPTGSASPGSDNGGVAYSRLYRRVLAFNCDGSTDLVTVAYRDHDTSRLDEWENTTFTLETGIATGENNIRVRELADGTMIMVVRVSIPAGVLTGPGLVVDYDVYHSTDGGLTWSIVSRYARYRRSNQDPSAAITTDDLSKQFSLSVSGDYVRIDWINTNGNGRVQSLVSRDRGITWAFVDTIGLATYDNGATDSPGWLSVVDVDGLGTFMMAYQTTATDLTIATAYGADAYAAIGSAGATAPQQCYAGVLVKALGWIWLFYEYDDSGVIPDAAWGMRRVRASEYETAAGWQELDEIWPKGVNLYTSGRLDAVWTGDSIVFWAANVLTSTGVDDTEPSLWYALGWSRRSLGIFGPATPDIATATDTLTLWTHTWDVRQGAPNSAGWTLVQTGGFSTYSLAEQIITTTAAAQTRYYELSSALTNELWAGLALNGRGSCVEWEVNLLTSAFTTAADDLAVRLIALNFGLDFADISVRLSSSSVVVYDNNAGASIASVAIDLSNSRYVTLRLWMGEDYSSANTFSCQLGVLDSAIGSSWQDSAVAAMTMAGGGTTNRIQWGHLTQTGAGVVSSKWRRVSVNGFDMLHQGSLYGTGTFPGGYDGFTNPGFLIGMSAGLDSPVAVESGLSLHWSGISGAEGDQYDGSVDHAYAAEHVFEDSPRVMWRSNGLPSNQVEGLATTYFNVSAWTLPSATAVDASITDPFGVAGSASQITFSNASPGIRLVARYIPPATSSVVLNNTAPYRGYTLSFWLRVDSSSAAPVAISFDVGDGDGSVSTGSVAADDTWRRFELYVQGNGVLNWLDILVNGYAGASTILVFSLFDVTLTPQTEIILQNNGDDAELRQTLDAMGLFNTNFRRCLIDEDTDPNFGSPTTHEVLDAARYGSGAAPWAITGTTGRALTMADTSPGPASEPDGIMTGLFIRGATGERSLESYSVGRHRKTAAVHVVHLDDLTQDAATEGWAADDTLIVYGPTIVHDFSTPLTGATYLRIRIIDQTTAAGWYQIGSAVVGLRKTLDVPLDWSFTDNEQGNVSMSRTRSGISWAHEEGPPSRAIQARVIGDVQAWREELRLVQRELGYERRCMVLVLDEDYKNESAIYGRIMSGNQQDNAAWYIDATGTPRTAGDLSMLFVEEP